MATSAPATSLDTRPPRTARVHAYQPHLPPAPDPDIIRAPEPSPAIHSPDQPMPAVPVMPTPPNPFEPTPVSPTPERGTPEHPEPPLPRPDSPATPTGLLGQR